MQHMASALTGGTAGLPQLAPTQACVRNTMCLLLHYSLAVVTAGLLLTQTAHAGAAAAYCGTLAAPPALKQQLQ